MSTISIIIFVAIMLTVVVFLVWFLMQDAFVRVDPGQIGLVITRGKPASKGMPPGVHFVLRFGRVMEVYPAVELAYLTVADAEAARIVPDNLTFTDPPIRATLGDRAAATVQYTVRFQPDLEKLGVVHLRFGTAGIKGAVRDISRRVLLTSLANESVGIGGATGSALVGLESEIGAALAEQLAESGFKMTMFNLREIDLAETGAVIQSTVRAQEEVARERAQGAVRAARAEQESEINDRVLSGLSEGALEYLRIQAMRELIERWDGQVLGPQGGVGLPAPAKPPTGEIVNEA